MSCYLHSQGEDPPKICGPCSEMSGLKSASAGVRNLPCAVCVCVFFGGEPVAYHDMIPDMGESSFCFLPCFPFFSV